MGYVFGFLLFRYPETLKQTFFGRETHQFAGWKLAGFVSGRVPLVPFSAGHHLKDHLSGWFIGKLSHGYNEVFPMVVGSFRQKSPKELHDLHPRNLTWNLKISPWKRKVLLETMIFRFHVKFRGCITGGDPITTEPSTGNQPVASSGRRSLPLLLRVPNALRWSLGRWWHQRPVGRLRMHGVGGGWLGRVPLPGTPKGCEKMNGKGVPNEPPLIRVILHHLLGGASIYMYNDM